MCWSDIFEIVKAASVPFSLQPRTSVKCPLCSSCHQLCILLPLKHSWQRYATVKDIQSGLCQMGHLSSCHAPGDTTLHSTLSADRNELIHKPKPPTSVTLRLLLKRKTSWSPALSVPSKQGENPQQKALWIILSLQVFILMINGTTIQTMLRRRIWKEWLHWHSWPFPRRTLCCLKGLRPPAYFPDLASSVSIQRFHRSGWTAGVRSRRTFQGCQVNRRLITALPLHLKTKGLEFRRMHTYMPVILKIGSSVLDPDWCAKILCIFIQRKFFICFR